MFRNKNRALTLTATTCGLLEELRLALQVLMGTPIRFKHLEFKKCLESGHGCFYNNDQEFELTFIRTRGTDSFFDLTINGRSSVARFLPSGKVAVTSIDQVPCVWWIGSCDVVRWGEPLGSFEGIEK